MKKLLVLLMVLGIVAPSMAAVTLTGSGASPTLVATIGYSWDGTGARPRAFALTVTASAGTITAVTPTFTGAGAGYGIFPGSISIEPNGTVGTIGSPVEPASLPGASGTGIGTSSVVVALGSLYAPSGVAGPNQPAAIGKLFTVTCSSPCTLTVAPETTYRGGIVDENAATMTVNTPNPLTVQLDYFPPTNAHYSDWVSLGKPNCWCAPPLGSGYQCMGDADGAKTAGTGYRVYSNDLTILVANWKFKDTTPGLNPCACFDHTKTAGTGYRVYSNDLTILVNNWKKKDTDLNVNGVPPCGLN